MERILRQGNIFPPVRWSTYYRLLKKCRLHTGRRARVLFDGVFTLIDAPHRQSGKRKGWRNGDRNGERNGERHGERKGSGTPSGTASGMPSGMAIGDSFPPLKCVRHSYGSVGSMSSCTPPNTSFPEALKQRYNRKTFRESPFRLPFHSLSPKCGLPFTHRRQDTLSV